MLALTRRELLGTVVPSVFALSSGKLNARPAPGAIELGARRELFVDRFLIGQTHNVELRLQQPVDAGPVLELNRPWEGRFCAYFTVIRDGALCRLYYRGMPEAGQDGRTGEVTCYAESRDGIRWTRPDLGLFEVRGTRKNNAILAGMPPLTHNFCPFLDTRPGVSGAQRFKALAGISRSGLIAFQSQDGIRWQKLREQPVLTQGAFDSQNLAFWSESEQCYVCYFRTFKAVGGVRYRWISRATSQDFVNWTPPEEMSFGEAPPEHLYTNQTSPYFRAPHIYVSICARFQPGRQVLEAEQARSAGVHASYFGDTSDAVLLSSRGGNRYDRTFLESFLRPGLGEENWVSRTNYPALNLVQTGPAEMSLYVQRHYAQPTAHLRRYILRLDGFASVRAPYRGGEFITKPLLFRGRKLEINYSTSAAGSIRVEIQDASGAPVPGYRLQDAVEIIGDEIERVVTWQEGSDVSRLAGQPVRLRFVMKDGDLYSFRFQD